MLAWVVVRERWFVAGERKAESEAQRASGTFPVREDRGVHVALRHGGVGGFMV